jgi:hypothetical protein
MAMFRFEKAQGKSPGSLRMASLFMLSALCVAQPAHAGDAFMSMMDSANYSGVQFAGTLAINSTLNGGRSGMNQQELDAYNAYHKQRTECRNAAIRRTQASTPARTAGFQNCNAQFPVRPMSDFIGKSGSAATAKKPLSSGQRPTGQKPSVAPTKTMAQIQASGAYRPSASVLVEVQDRFYTSLKPVSRSTADEVRSKLFNQDIEKIFGDAVRPFGLKPGNVIDATTAYTVSMWVISNQAANPSPQQVAGARQQIGKMLSDTGKLNGSDADKQRMSQMMMYETILGLVAFNDSRINKAQLAAATSRNMVRRGLDMKGMILTDAGFVAR